VAGNTIRATSTLQAQSILRTSLYVGAELVYTAPSLLLRAVAALTALTVAVAPMMAAFTGGNPDPLNLENDNNRTRPIVLWRATNGTSPNQFLWDPDRDEDGLSMFDRPWGDKEHCVGFNALETRGGRWPLAAFIEPELLGISAIYTPEIERGHWSVIVGPEDAQSYAARFSQAAKRIKIEDPLRWVRRR